MLRAAYSETIGRPDYVSIQGGRVLGTIANRAGGGGTIGVPSLLPLESKNYDFWPNGITPLPAIRRLDISGKETTNSYQCAKSGYHHCWHL